MMTTQPSSTIKPEEEPRTTRKSSQYIVARKRRKHSLFSYESALSRSTEEDQRPVEGTSADFIIHRPAKKHNVTRKTLPAPATQTLLGDLPLDAAESAASSTGSLSSLLFGSAKVAWNTVSNLKLLRVASTFCQPVVDHHDYDSDPDADLYDTDNPCPVPRCGRRTTSSSSLSSNNEAEKIVLSPMLSAMDGREFSSRARTRSIEGVGSEMSDRRLQSLLSLCSPRSLECDEVSCSVSQEQNFHRTSSGHDSEHVYEGGLSVSSTSSTGAPFSVGPGDLVMHALASLTQILIFGACYLIKGMFVCASSLFWMCGVGKASTVGLSWREWMWLVENQNIIQMNSLFCDGVQPITGHTDPTKLYVHKNVSLSKQHYETCANEIVWDAQQSLVLLASQGELFADRHAVETSDGYILVVHRLKKMPPVVVSKLVRMDQVSVARFLFLYLGKSVTLFSNCCSTIKRFYMETLLGFKSSIFRSTTQELPSNQSAIGASTAVIARNPAVQQASKNRQLLASTPTTLSLIRAAVSRFESLVLAEEVGRLPLPTTSTTCEMRPPFTIIGDAQTSGTMFSQPEDVPGEHPSDQRERVPVLFLHGLLESSLNWVIPSIQECTLPSVWSPSELLKGLWSLICPVEAGYVPISRPPSNEKLPSSFSSDDQGPSVPPTLTLPLLLSLDQYVREDFDFDVWLLNSRGNLFTKKTRGVRMSVILSDWIEKSKTLKACMEIIVGNRCRGARALNAFIQDFREYYENLESLWTYNDLAIRDIESVGRELLTIYEGEQRERQDLLKPVMVGVSQGACTFLLATALGDALRKKVPQYTTNSVYGEAMMKLAEPEAMDSVEGLAALGRSLEDICGLNTSLRRIQPRALLLYSPPIFTASHSLKEKNQSGTSTTFVSRFRKFIRALLPTADDVPSCSNSWVCRVAQAMDKFKNKVFANGAVPVFLYCVKARLFLVALLVETGIMILPPKILSFATDFITRRIFNFYLSDLSTPTYRNMFKHTPNGSTSKKNLSLYLDRMISQKPLCLPLHLSKEDNNMGRGPQPSTNAVPSMDASHWRDALNSVESQGIDVLKLCGCCHVSVWLGGKDNLVDAKRTAEYFLKGCPFAQLYVVQNDASQAQQCLPSSTRHFPGLCAQIEETSCNKRLNVFWHVGWSHLDFTWSASQFTAVVPSTLCELLTAVYRST